MRPPFFFWGAWRRGGLPLLKCWLGLNGVVSCVVTSAARPVETRTQSYWKQATQVVIYSGIAMQKFKRQRKLCFFRRGPVTMFTLINTSDIWFFLVRLACDLPKQFPFWHIAKGCGVGYISHMFDDRWVDFHSVTFWSLDAVRTTQTKHSCKWQSFNMMCTFTS